MNSYPFLLQAYNVNKSRCIRLLSILLSLWVIHKLIFIFYLPICECHFNLCRKTKISRVFGHSLGRHRKIRQNKYLGRPIYTITKSKHLRKEKLRLIIKKTHRQYKTQRTSYKTNGVIHKIIFIFYLPICECHFNLYFNVSNSWICVFNEH
jgi:hypothetical protein